ncbi:MAG: DUF4293 domain-containing protein [Prevotellaceae bacterium]|nr:DUF4293 domain-containing protein [Prevotella sp.]MDD7258442.1 DUF4293 domain-containing protein [Prevotellaceae bacterium]MDY6130024.1 DUF4293 domain-containing protein [Prevotella sp.]
MIQRKQTLFLIVAIILTVVCLCLPIGRFVPESMGVTSLMFNLWIQTGNGSHDFSVWALFAILLLTCSIALWAIFSYKNRTFQSRLCLFNMLLLLGWYAVYAVFAIILGKDQKVSFSVEIAACLPFISLILHFLARKGIQADEALIKSMDRIR